MLFLLNPSSYEHVFVCYSARFSPTVTYVIRENILHTIPWISIWITPILYVQIHFPSSLVIYALNVSYQSTKKCYLFYSNVRPIHIRIIIRKMLMLNKWRKKEKHTKCITQNVTRRSLVFDVIFCVFIINFKSINITKSIKFHNFKDFSLKIFEYLFNLDCV